MRKYVMAAFVLAALVIASIGPAGAYRSCTTTCYGNSCTTNCW